MCNKADKRSIQESIFLVSLQKPMLWVLIRSALLMENKKQNKTSWYILQICIYADSSRKGTFFLTEKYRYFYFSIKTYVQGTRQKGLADMLLMSTHNIGFYKEIRKYYIDIPSYLEIWWRPCLRDIYIWATSKSLWTCADSDNPAHAQRIIWAQLF